MIFTPEFKKASSRRRFSSISNEYSKLEKVSVDARNLTSVPLSSAASPKTLRCSTVSPCSNRAKCSLPSRHTRSSNHTDNAFTTDTPTPCKPPETLYELLSNLPPAWSCVMITSAADTPSSS